MTKKLELTDDDLLVLNDALMEMPFRRAAPLVHKINEQLATQRELALVEKDVPEPKAEKQ